MNPKAVPEFPESPDIARNIVRDDDGGQPSRFARITLWMMFFTICFGLGYPTLSRYNPTEVGGTSDSLQYFRIVVDGPSAAQEHWRYRILVPYLARPIHRLAANHVGTWNPVSFSLLAVNSAFCASSALLLMMIAQGFGFSFATGVIAAFCYLLNFDVANFQLAGMVDSAEAFLFICLFLSLAKRWWNVLPILGLVGGLAKETFLPVAFLFACGWVWQEKRKPWVQIFGMAVAGIAAVLLVRSMVEGHFVSPLQIIGSERAIEGPADLARAAMRAATSWSTWITFLWVAPFALRGIGFLRKEAVCATVFGLAGALALVVWNDAGSNGARPFFNIAGPCVCLAFAMGVAKHRWPDP